MGKITRNPCNQGRDGKGRGLGKYFRISADNRDLNYNKYLASRRNQDIPHGRVQLI